MLKSAVLSFAILAIMAGSAAAGDRYRDRYDAPPPPVPGARYYGPVTNYYGQVTIYGASEAAYPAQGADYSAYGPGYATAPQWDANSYGAGYGTDGFSGGYGYGATAYPAYGYGYGYPPSNEGQRLDPWNGYNGGPGNGYW